MIIAFKMLSICSNAWERNSWLFFTIYDYLVEPGTHIMCSECPMSTLPFLSSKRVLYVIASFSKRALNLWAFVCIWCNANQYYLNSYVVDLRTYWKQSIWNFLCTLPTYRRKAPDFDGLVSLCSSRSRALVYDMFKQWSCCSVFKQTVLLTM